MRLLFCGRPPAFGQNSTCIRPALCPRPARSLRTCLRRLLPFRRRSSNSVARRAESLILGCQAVQMQPWSPRNRSPTHPSTVSGIRARPGGSDAADRPLRPGAALPPFGIHFAICSIPFKARTTTPAAPRGPGVTSNFRPSASESSQTCVGARLTFMFSTTVSEFTAT